MNSVSGLLLSSNSKPMFMSVEGKSSEHQKAFQDLMNRFSLMEPSDVSGLVDELETVDETVLETMQTFIQLYVNTVNKDELLHLMSEKFSIDIKNVEEIFSTMMDSENSKTDLTVQGEQFYFTDQIISVDNLMSDEAIYHVQLFVYEVQKMLHQLESDTDSLKQVSSRILSLLQQWTKMNSEEQHIGKELMNEELTKEEQKIWNKLVTLFEKRNEYSGYGNYRSQATVTRNDVMNWLHQFTPKIVQEQAFITGDVSRPMTEVEQYVLHVQSTSKVERISNEFMQKFTAMIHQSRFGKMDNELTQLSITVRPENLGNMTLRFIQMDGEMVVKIIVSSQMARELLESNTHQLKHLFAPHQIIIERDEAIPDEQFFSEEQMDEQLNEDGPMEESDKNNDSKTDQQNEVDFETLLAALEGG